MDKKDEELKKHLEEDLKKRMENTEFNNYEEDIEVSKEEEIKEKEENFLDEKDTGDKKNLIIIILGVVVAILIIVLVFFLLTGGKKDSNSSSNNGNDNGSESENNNNDDGSDENDMARVINEEDYNYSQAKVYLNKYVSVPAKAGDKQALTDLEGNILAKVNKSWAIYEGTDSSIYLANNEQDGKINIRRIKDNIVKDIFNEKATGLLFANEKDTLLGVYKEDKNNDILYIFNGDKYDTVTLNSHAAYIYNTHQGESKYIYNNKYVITFGEQDNEKFSNFGLYDLKNKKQVIDGSYDKIQYLKEDTFVAVKNGYAGVINKDGKELLPFDYDLVTYSNGLYFIGRENKLYVFDSNLNNLSTTIDVPNLEDFVYSPCCGSINPFDLIAFKSYVIVRIGNDPTKLSDYMAVDKKGAITQLGKGHIAIEGNFLIKSNESDNYLLLYDAEMKVQHKFDMGKKATGLDNVHFYLGNTLVLNNKYLYNLSNNTNKGTTSWYRRTSQEYEVRIDFKGDTGTVTVSSGEEVLKTLDNVSVEEFLKANNNGITITKSKFIYNAGGVIILDRVEQTPANALLDFVGLFE